MHITTNASNIKTKPKINITKTSKRTSKVLITGDSHKGGCASNLLNSYDEFFEVNGNLLPGTSLQNITQTAKNELRTLNHNDFVVIWRGSNDINRN
jgi:hypothetical protein